ncbi:MAG: 2-hydroxyglutaryl-CoA dehydratase [Chloroflexi bacterium]|nr:2-hydroxyglutaryl-CoA dehydratase [Chloroflexota bacterium]
MLVAGIDVGSRATKAVVLDGERNLRACSVLRTRPPFPELARQALDEALSRGGLRGISPDYVATTGFGRYNVPFRDLQVTEITSAARGASFLYPSTRYVLDIGFQSTRAMKLGEGGRVREFHTNDKCAAGAGGFIERAARYLEVGLEKVGELSLRADNPQTISSVCAVLAESEIINHVSEGKTVENILRGAHLSLATRALALLRRVGLDGETTFVGGVVYQAGMVRSLEETLKVKLNVPAQPELVGALGAALLALQRLEKQGAIPKSPVEPAT